MKLDFYNGSKVFSIQISTYHRSEEIGNFMHVLLFNTIYKLRIENKNPNFQAHESII